MILPNSFGFDEFVGCRDGVFPGFFELLQLCGVLPDSLVAFGDVGGIGDLDFCESGFLGGVVGGADLVGAFERHVLEHVGEAGGAAWDPGRSRRRPA